MPATNYTTDDVTTALGMPVAFYPPRLDEADLRSLEYWARYCLRNDPKSRLLSAYLSCIVSLECERRKAEDDGDDVLEVAMTPLPCNAWSNAEVVAALLKSDAIVRATDGEVKALMEKLHVALLVEAAYRLDPSDVAGVGAAHKQGQGS